MDVTDGITLWYNLYIVPGDLAPKTVEMYAASIKRLSASRIGCISLDQLTPIDCRGLIVQEMAEHPRCAQIDRLTLMRAFRVLRKSGCSCPLLDEDTFPAVHHKAAVKAVLTPEQFGAYIVAAQQQPLGVLLLLCLCGLRRGQALGVRCTDISGGVLTIRRQRVRVGGQLLCTDLKTESSHRALVLPDCVLALCRDGGDEWLVDTIPEALTRAHKRTVRRIGAEGVTLHGLRHSFATLAASAGVGIKLLQVCLGHADYGVTADLYANHITAPSAIAPLVFASLRGA